MNLAFKTSLRPRHPLPSSNPSVLHPLHTRSASSAAKWRLFILDCGIDSSPLCMRISVRVFSPYVRAGQTEKHEGSDGWARRGQKEKEDGGVRYWNFEIDSRWRLRYNRCSLLLRVRDFSGLFRGFFPFDWRAPGYWKGFGEFEGAAVRGWNRVAYERRDWLRSRNLRVHRCF